MKRDLREGMKGYYELSGDKYPVTLIERPREKYGVFVVQFDRFDGQAIIRNPAGRKLEITYRKNEQCFKPKSPTAGRPSLKIGRIYLGEWKSYVKM